MSEIGTLSLEHLNNGAQFQQVQFWVTPHQFPPIPQLTIRFF